MTRIPFRFLAATLVVVGAAACGENSTSPRNGLLDLTGAFSSIPIGYNYTANSFNGVPDGAPGEGWSRGRDHFDGGLMGGGMGPQFMGLGFGLGMGHGHFGDDHMLGNCTYNAGSGRVECPVQTFGGLTITRSAAYADASGKAQSAFDSVTTNSINDRVTVSGTFTRRDSAVSSVQNASDRTVSGLAQGSTQRTINGTSAGKETTVGKDSTGAFTAVRTVGDTTNNVVIPVPAAAGGPPPYPTAGTVIRAMQASITYAGQAPQSTSRREVITYDGSATAKLVITQDGTTRNCTIALPRGRPVCQ